MPLDIEIKAPLYIGNGISPMTAYFNRCQATLDEQRTYQN